MSGKIVFIWFLLLSFGSFAQEVCDNGIDDDSDGLIDLLDPDCHCGAGLNAQLNNAIPNSNFDTSLCCPTSWFGYLNCLDSWTTDTTFYNNSWALNYVSSCNACSYWNNTTAYISPPECSTSTDNGFLGMGFWNWGYNTAWNYNNYASTCLNAPFYPGNTYVLEFSAFNTFNYNWLITDDTIHISLFGSTSCANVPVNNQSCYDPNWDGLDSIEIIVPVDSTWHQYSFSFSPTDTIYAMALGQTCSAYNNNQNYSGWQRILLDNLILYDSKEYNLQITESGSVCTPPHILTASIDTLGGTWQWYKDSVAIVGQTNDSIDITTLGAGNYTALYNLNNTCQGLNLEVTPAVYPLAFLSSINTPTCAGDSISFDGFSYITSGTIDHYYYDFGNGDSAFVEDPVYAFDSAGTYIVTHTAESDLGCQTSQNVTININAKPNVDFIASNECLYDSVNFVSLASLTNGLMDSLSWEFGDNTFSQDSVAPHLYSNSGNYNVELFARSDQGCVDSLTKTITINPAPVADYSAANNCENISVGFVNASNISNGAIANYAWDFGDNNYSNILNTSHVYSSEGNYNTSLIVTSDSGCVDTATLILNIYPEPVANFNFSNSCFQANFTNISTIPTGNITSVNWDFGNSVSSVDFDTDHYYSANGNYNVSLQVTSDFGCVDDTIIPITISNNFYADFTPIDTFICSGESIQFINQSTQSDNLTTNYVWQLSDGQTSDEENPLFTFPNNTDQDIMIDVFFKLSTNTGCIDSILRNNAITVIPSPAANFMFSPEEPTISNSEVQFINLSSRAENYTWNFGDNTTSNNINPTHIYPDISKSYTVKLTAYDSDNICSDEFAKLLVIQDEILFFIPNAFTPDGSGKNDEFVPQFVSGIDIYNFKLQIFNRWGEVVFESNDPSIGWDGMYAGDIIDQGIYIWKIDFAESIYDKVHTHIGTVNVLR